MKPESRRWADVPTEERISRQWLETLLTQNCRVLTRSDHDWIVELTTDKAARCAAAVLWGAGHPHWKRCSGKAGPNGFCVRPNHQRLAPEPAHASS